MRISSSVTKEGIRVFIVVRQFCCFSGLPFYRIENTLQVSDSQRIYYENNAPVKFVVVLPKLIEICMETTTWMSSNVADGSQQKHLLPCFATKA